MFREPGRVTSPSHAKPCVPQNSRMIGNRRVENMEYAESASGGTRIGKEDLTVEKGRV